MRPTIYSDTKTHFILGDPIEHSLSPIIFNMLYTRYGMNTICLTAQVKKGDLGIFMQTLDMLRVCAMNITIPHKVDIIPFMDTIDPMAREFSSVNSVFVREKKLIGFSTDAQGFSLSLKEAGLSFSGQHIVILGAGGAAAPIAIQAAIEGAASISILARQLESAQGLADRILDIAFLNCRAGELKNAVQYTPEATLLINTTPLGMKGYGQDFEQFDFIDALPRRSAVYDIVYSPPNTRLLQRAKRRGIKTIGGIGMLIWQAFAAFEKYYGFMPSSQDIPSILATMRDGGYKV